VGGAAAGVVPASVMRAPGMGKGWAGGGDGGLEALGSSGVEHEQCAAAPALLAPSASGPCCSRRGR
jgi:hypothetical protein